MVNGEFFLRRSRPNFCVDSLRLPFVLPPHGGSARPRRAAGPRRLARRGLGPLPLVLKDSPLSVSL
jgi:hypothetical protein